METFNNILGAIDNFVWGVPLMVLILAGGVLLTVRLGLLQVRHLGKALKFRIKNEEDAHGEVTSFGALCTALSATIGTGNIVGVATAVCTGGSGRAFLDGSSRILRYGYKVFRRPSGCQIQNSRS